MPPELARALKGDRRLPKWFAGLSYSMRKEIGDWVNEPKSAESREKRAERMAERLLLTLEGEIEPPPILQAAFLRQPLARKGWEAMTPTQRRGHLLGIFWLSERRIQGAPGGQGGRGGAARGREVRRGHKGYAIGAGCRFDYSLEDSISETILILRATIEPEICRLIE